MKPGDDDRRYRISVILVATPRPKYWTFHCVNCGIKVSELSGEVIYLADVDDMNKGKTAMNVRCPGKYCQFWYEFTLN